MTDTHGGRVVTLTANPSLDRTLDLPGPLVAGGIVRLGRRQPPSPAARASTWPARSPPRAATSSRCCRPPPSDPIVTALRGARASSWPPCRCRRPVRTNYTLVDPDGTTTKLNEPGAAAVRGHPHRADRRPARARRRRAVGRPVRLPPAVDAGRLVRRAGRAPCGTPAPGSPSTPARRPLLALLAAGPDAAPDLLKPNAEELAQLAGVSEDDVLRRPGGRPGGRPHPARARRRARSC